ncbi:MAG: DUF2231 domain-containing protein [FCB group bacterium]|jgi:uncharacterized membrane protein
MFSFPPISGLPGLHPFIIHFPVAFLLLAPFVILVGLIMREKRIYFSLAGVILMGIGTLFIFAANITGESASDAFEKSGQLPQYANSKQVTPQEQQKLKAEIKDAIEDHEDLAETIAIFFSILTAIYVIILIIPKIIKKLETYKFAFIFNICFLILYFLCLIVMLNAAHQGGLLVHKFGVHALLR